MRVLFADDQIPDDDIPDGKIFETIKKKFQLTDQDDGFARAFEVMRHAKRAVSEGNDVVVARNFEEAMSLAKTQSFDAAIIDLGWYADESVADPATAGWKIGDALAEADHEHPDRPPTAQIVYSARFTDSPQLGEIAAKKLRLPMPKPYAERYTIPLGSLARTAKNDKAEDAACQSLRATLSFIEHVRASGTDRRADRMRTLDTLLSAATTGMTLARKREEQWNRLTQVVVTLSVLIVLAGVVSLFFLGVPQGAVTASVGIVTGLISKVMYTQLQKAQNEIHTAAKELSEFVTQAQALTSSHQP